MLSTCVPVVFHVDDFLEFYWQVNGKPMQELIKRLEKLQNLQFVTFGDDLLLNTPVCLLMRLRLSVWVCFCAYVRVLARANFFFLGVCEKFSHGSRASQLYNRHCFATTWGSQTARPELPPAHAIPCPPATPRWRVLSALRMVLCGEERQPPPRGICGCGL